MRNEDSFRKIYLPRPALRKGAAAAMLTTLRSGGGFSLAAKSQRRRNSLLILCYHGISLRDEHKWWPHLFITAEHFRQRLECLRRVGASVLPLGEALIRLQKGSLPPRSVVLTFDDGFYDFLEHAAPMLSEFGFPCTLYLTTHYCGYRLPIINLILDYLLWKAGKDSIRLPEFGLETLQPVQTYDQRQKVVKHLLNWIERREMSTTGKDEIAQMVAGNLGIDYRAILQRRILQILSPSEVMKVASAGIDVQLHTHRHRTPRDRTLFLAEIEDNRRRIVELTGKDPVHFCYPSGQYSPEFFGWLSDAGIKSATTCESGLALRSSQSMKLPRVLDDSGMSSLRFESAIAGLFV